MLAESEASAVASVENALDQACTALNTLLQLYTDQHLQMLQTPELVRTQPALEMWCQAWLPTAARVSLEAHVAGIGSHGGMMSCLSDF
jgi:hypothetical protein